MDGVDVQTGLDAAIAEALKSGTDEITRLSALAERTIDHYAVSALRSDATWSLAWPGHQPASRKLSNLSARRSFDG